MSELFSYNSAEHVLCVVKGLSHKDVSLHVLIRKYRIGPNKHIVT